jgi:multicomponent Na+:H+ antiporter subunit G
MTLDDILTLLAGICLLLGAFLCFAAGVGLLRFPDVPTRLHAATKPQILACSLCSPPLRSRPTVGRRCSR